jgi:hypothetical protein
MAQVGAEAGCRLVNIFIKSVLIVIGELLDCCINL